MKRDMVCPECGKKGFSSKIVNFAEGGKIKCYHCGKWSAVLDYVLPGTWIAADSWMPAFLQRVWVWPYEQTAYYLDTCDTPGHEHPKGWYFDSGTDPIEGVTHWMALPLPPKE